ncbi:MAG TPA: aromatic-ring-hydroxylating dioxygenase [Cycloclasticus sp.]|jgi:3-phenylpropionate/cinnamic acid dioxygenase small subunit|nr:aromatic-ring-hydroxylating dioxygenase [Cycloclasticus sp.]HIL92291.1 aromatic-ring-hydroxylating dioxygenase [Cycloclasticus sp.]
MTDKSNSQTSYYLNDAFYDRLMRLVDDWRLDDGVSPALSIDGTDKQACESLIVAEARLADDLRLEAWLDCYSDESVYWIPSSYPAADPRQEITLEFHDKRRLQDRVARIRTGVAYSMVPVIRTRHILGHVEYWQGDTNEIRARASFIIDALFNDKHRILSGWMGYSLVKEKNDWKIAVKQINLIDADCLQENNTFFL